MINAAIIICSRPQSSRLPGKVFMEVAGVPAIKHILGRVAGCGLPVIVAVPDGCHDYDHLAQDGVTIFCGNPDSPLHRMAEVVDAMPEHKRPKWIVRITHDDILIDQITMLKLLKACDENPAAGYGVCPSIVDGAGVEVIRIDNLLHAARTRTEPTEFVSYFVKSKPFPKTITIAPRISVMRPYRLTMDYYEDWVVLDTVLARVGPGASLDAVCYYLDTHAHILAWNRQPLVTFYTCVRDGEKFIRKAMRSVLNNAGFDFEYIVVDDGSRDATAVIVSEFAGDRRLRFFKNRTSLGLASSSNIALSKSRGKYIMRIDADDVLLPYAAETMIQTMEKEKAGAVYAAYCEIDANGKILRGNNNLDPREVHHAGCALFDKKLLNEIRFTEGLRHFDGADLHLRMKDRAMIAYVDSPLWHYRRHDKNLSNSDRDERARVRTELGIGAATATTLGVSSIDRFPDTAIRGL